MRDVAFFYRKKNGLRISDSGLADVFLGGNGITVKVVIGSTTADRENGDSIFKVKSVVTKVDALKFSVRDVRSNLCIDRNYQLIFSNRASTTFCIKHCVL